MDSFKNPENFLTKLFKLYREKRIIIATNNNLRREYKSLVDGEDPFVTSLFDLIKTSKMQGLHLDLNDNIPCFTEGSIPEDLRNVSTALITKTEAKNREWGDAYLGISNNPGYVISTNLDHINDKPQRIKRRTQCKKLEQELY